MSTNGVEAYSKEILNDKIRRLTAVNIQLITNKMEIEKVRVNLEVNRVRLFDKKNSLVAKREEFRTEIAVLNVAGLSNILIYGYQDPFLRPTQDKLKAKRPLLFNGLKENFQRFFIRTRYYQGFY